MTHMREPWTAEAVDYQYDKFVDQGELEDAIMGLVRFVQDDCRAVGEQPSLVWEDVEKFGHESIVLTMPDGSRKRGMPVCRIEWEDIT